MGEVGKPKIRYTDVLDLTVSCIFLWIVCNPGQLEKIKDKTIAQWAALRHKISVWQTLQDIRKYPEI